MMTCDMCNGEGQGINRQPAPGEQSTWLCTKCEGTGTINKPNSGSYPLTFTKLEAASLKRSEVAYGHKLDDWSPTDWACAN